MTLLLRRMSSQEGRYSNHVVPRLIRLTMETNTLTASVAVISLALYIAFPVR
ncbi:hypothetical protein BC826DRAFT_1029722 [Russula brevipes]|nr:hypothetical protein BC826DRAFT_1029722 [Russula brevipes]